MITDLAASLLAASFICAVCYLLALLALQEKRPTLKVKLLEPGAKLPAQANDCAAGYDLFNLADMCVAAHETKRIRTGVAVEMPPGFFGMIRPRGSAMVRGMAIQGTIDSDYRGEIMIIVHNTTASPVILDAGKAVAQMILTPYATLLVEPATELSDTARGAKGFGSTGNA